MEDPSLCSNIKLSTEYTDLNCKNLIGMKICFISFTHFRGKESGEYYTYHTDYFGKDVKYYDVPAITVTLPKINFIDISIDDHLNQKVKYISENPIIDFETSYLDDDNIFDNSIINKFFMTFILNNYNDKRQIK